MASDTDALQLRSRGGFVRAFGELFDHFPVEGWDVVWLATRNQAIVHDDFFINPARASVAVCPSELPAGSPYGLFQGPPMGVELPAKF
jgi:hypothetical protein